MKIFDRNDIIISSNIDDIILANERGLPSIFVYQGNLDNVPFFVKYVTSDADSIDEDYINEVIARFYGLPLIIGETKRLIIKELTCGEMVYLTKEMIKEENICKANNHEFFVQIDEYEEEAIRLKHKEYIRCQYGYYGYGYWGIFLKDSGKLVGRAGIENKEIIVNNSKDFSCNKINQTYCDLIKTDNTKDKNAFDKKAKDSKNTFLQVIEGGYYVLPEFRKCGYAFEAFEFIGKLAKERFEIKKLYFVIDENNNPSIKLAKRLGCLELDGLFTVRNSKRCNIYSMLFFS